MMDSNAKKTDITIDLTLISGASVLQSKEILSKPQYTELFKHVSDILGKISDFTKSLDKKTQKIAHYRVHDVITVHGKRGTGKTSFLLSSLELLKDKKSIFDEYKSISDDVCVLDIMDPTLFACREHLLHALLSQIKKKISEYSKNKEVIDFSGNSEEEKWIRKLQHLAVGLKAIGEVREDVADVSSKGMQWEDPEYLMQYDMETIQHSMELEQAFHKIIRDALKILGKKAFVLALDDTDTRPAIGWHVLEVLRRYFTTPQLIVIISGDLDLFATIIRQKHIDSLKLQENYHSPPIEALKKIVTGLTEQYILKILRPNLRIRLGNFPVIMSHYKNRSIRELLAYITVKKGEENKEDTLEKLVETFFDEIGCHHEPERRLFREVLINNPIRTVVQIIEALYERQKGISNKSAGLSERNFAFRLCEIFFTQIRDFGFSPFKLQEELTTTHGITHLMKKMLPHRHMALGMSLLPSYENSDENQALLCLYVNFLHATRYEPSIVLAYMFKACLLREVFSKNFSNFDEVEFWDIKNYLRLEIDEPLYKTVKRITGLLWTSIENSSRTAKYGTMLLRKESYVNDYKYDFSREAINFLSSTENTGEIIVKIFRNHCCNDISLFGDQFVHTLSSLRARITSWHKNFIMPGAVSLNIGDEKRNLFSILSLIAFMGDLLMCKREEEIFLLLKKSKNRDFFSAYSYQVNIHDEESIPEHASYEDSEDIIFAPEADKIDDISKILFSWIGKVKKVPRKNLFPTLCARSMERFFNAIGSIKNDFSGCSFLGKYVHRCIVLFLNSILVEEFYLSANVYSETMHVSLQNPINDDFIFMTNMINSNFFEYDLESAKKAKGKPSRASTNENYFIINAKEYPIFNFLFTCPLWGMFLNQNEKLILTQENEQMSVYKFYRRAIRESYKSTHDNPNYNVYSKLYNNPDEFFSVYFRPHIEEGVSKNRTKNEICLSNLYPALNLVAVSKKKSLIKPNHIVSEDFYSYLYDNILNESIKNIVSGNDDINLDFKIQVNKDLEAKFKSKKLLNMIYSSDTFYEKLFSMIKNSLKEKRDTNA